MSRNGLVCSPTWRGRGVVQRTTKAAVLASEETKIAFSENQKAFTETKKAIDGTSEKYGVPVTPVLSGSSGSEPAATKIDALESKIDKMQASPLAPLVLPVLSAWAMAIEGSDKEVFGFEGMQDN